MKSIVYYLKEYRVQSILAPLFKMLEALFELFVPVVITSIVDDGIARNDWNMVLRNGGLLFVLAVVGLISSITAQYFAATAASGFGLKLRRELFEHINHLSFSKIDKVGVSTLVTRITNDVNQTQAAVNMVLRLFMRSPFIVFGSMIMAFTVSAKEALIFVVVIPVLFVIVFGILLSTVPLYKRVQGYMDQLLRATGENLTGARVVRAFQMEQKEEEDFFRKNEALVSLQKATGKLSALLNPFTYVVINGGTIFLLWSGAIHVNSGSLTQGQLIALVNYMSQILVELIKLANLIIQVSRAMACYHRIQDVFMIPEEEAENKILDRIALKSKAQPDSDALFQLDHVFFHYEDAKEDALLDISFAVKKGMHVGVIGGTGSGKSTLMNLITGFYRPNKGSIFFEGQDLRESDRSQVLDKIAYVPQKAVLFTGTILSNIRLGKKDASKDEVEEAIRSAQAGEILEKKGIDAEVLAGGRNFSGGQRQRLTIARALVKKPEVLILDDSSSALDYKTDANLRNTIRKKYADTTTFIVSQRIVSIKDADLILVLDEGKLVASGSHEELLKTCQVYQEINASQEKGQKKEASHS